MSEDLKEKTRRLPDLPGVYLLKDKTGRVIYVGKAASLRHRVRSYLTAAETASPRLRSLQARLADLDFVVTDTEVEALILECSLIKEYRPRFNVNLKDDKDYPYLLLTPELYPRLELLRLSQKGGRRGRWQAFPGREERCFGPYTDVGAVRETMQFLGSVFPLRRCRQVLDGSPALSRPCLNYQMKRCLAPCRGENAVSPAVYDGLVKEVILFLQGRHGELEDRLAKQMDQAASDQRFEEAAALRDRLQSLQRVAGQQQKMLLSEKSADRDILALGRNQNRTAVHLFQVRDGKLLSQNHFLLSGTEGVEDEEIITSFIKTYYSRSEAPPREILVSAQPADGALLAQWLAAKAGRKVILRFPRRGPLKKLVELARRNCLLRLQEEEQKQVLKRIGPLRDLADLAGLADPPGRIEGYDVSHLRGGEPVAAMVVFREGEPSKEEYRLFNIRQAAAGDDYAALQEALQRRGRQGSWPRPDFILIDGGRGQLTAARAALNKTPLANVPLAALAKDPDQLFLESASLPLRFTADNNLLQLLQRLRNEGHRFAIGGHRRRRNRRSMHSRLEGIPGIGPARRAALLDHFGSLEKIKASKIDELARVPGISSLLATTIYNYLRGGEAEQ